MAKDTKSLGIALVVCVGILLLVAALLVIYSREDLRYYDYEGTSSVIPGDSKSAINVYVNAPSSAPPASKQYAEQYQAPQTQQQSQPSSYTSGSGVTHISYHYPLYTYYPKPYYYFAPYYPKYFYPYPYYPKYPKYPRYWW